MKDPTEIDLAPFLAAIVEMAGGEIRIPYDTLVNVLKDGDRAIAFDLEDEGMTMVLRMVDEIPND